MERLANAFPMALNDQSILSVGSLTDHDTPRHTLMMSADFISFCMIDKGLYAPNDDDDEHAVSKHSTLQTTFA